MYGTRAPTATDRLATGRPARRSLRSRARVLAVASLPPSRAVAPAAEAAPAADGNKVYNVYYDSSRARRAVAGGDCECARGG